MYVEHHDTVTFISYCEPTSPFEQQLAFFFTKTYVKSRKEYRYDLHSYCYDFFYGSEDPFEPRSAQMMMDPEKFMTFYHPKELSDDTMMDIFLMYLDTLETGKPVEDAPMEVF